MKKTPLPALLLAACLCLQSTAAALPNFIVIFIDDMGYGDIGPFGSKLNRTPHLDRMAKEGRRLTSFYVASPVCTPSRAALLTGSYPQRVGLARGSGHIVLFPGDPHGLHPDEVTIAETLKSVGYATGCFGKWHLGDQPRFLPTSQGFDTYYGIPYSNDMWPPLRRFKCPDLPVLRDQKVVELIKDMDGQATLCKKFTDAATDFIRQSKKAKKPFFVYLPHAFVHSPRKASPQFMARAKTVEQAQVEEVDWSVGQILDTVREEGLAESTLVLFTTDNGPAGGLSAGPLRGRKGSAFEGGQRVPTVVWWPDAIPAGTESDALTTAMDLHPTFAKLAGAKIPGDRVIDGRDVAPILLGKPGAKTPHDRFFYQQGGRLAAVRAGHWKLFLDGRLYNLREDLAESKNVAAAKPGVVKKLRALLEDFRQDLAANSRPVGHAKNSRTLVPRPGAKGEDAYRPTLSIK
jgi:arylsulfatase A-like enzyme